MEEFISELDGQFLFDQMLAEENRVIAERLPGMKIRKYRWVELEAM